MEGHNWFKTNLSGFLEVSPQPVFVDLLRSPRIDSQPGGPVRNPICRTGPPGYIGWRNRFFGIDSWAPDTFTNTETVFVDLLRRPGIDSQPGGPGTTTL